MVECITDEFGRELATHGASDFPCATYSTESTGFPWHWHDEFEAIHVLKGKVMIAAASERFVISANGGIFINSGVPHALIPCEGAYYEECDMVFHPRLVFGAMDSVLWTNYILPLTKLDSFPGTPLSSDIAREISNARKCLLEEPAMYEFSVRESLTRVVVSALMSARASASSSNTQRRMHGDRVKNMMSYLESRVDDDMYLDSLAAHVHLSPRECQREFKAYLGITPTQYLFQLRMARAAELLARGDMNVTDICGECGFQDTSYFAKKFKERFGVSPREYRRRFL